MSEISGVRKTIVAGKIVHKLQEVKEGPKTDESSPIGMFDSGIGGLTVLKEVQKQLSKESVIYLGDTARVPFGGRSKKEILNINHEIINYLMNLGVKMIIMACGTSSSLAYPLVKDKYKLPIVSLIEPGATAAATSTKNKKIGVIATVGTVGSHSYRKAINEINKTIKVYEISCPLLVPLVERGLTSSEETKRVVTEYLTPLIKSNIDTLILGCTHYPHLSNLIKEVTENKVTLIDPAEETIKEAKQILLRSKLASMGKTPPEYKFLVTSNPASFTSIGSRLLGKPVTGVQQVTLAPK